ncbi:MAG: (deoxy)nucleoside triphosphate pyrophosphohydrolase [Candidatus Goldbacteria bacterium]|nr:(deoxy)nucleoside triphosphate pyrophosphohydrolase [Candidatus Goldiibacteriota bacterium]
MIKVAAAVIIKGKKVLIAKRAKGDSHGLKWEFPGGKTEKGESLKACLKREIKEELDLDIKVGKKFEITKSESIELTSYLCEITAGDIKLNVHEEYKWAEIRSLMKYDFAPADSGAVSKLTGLKINKQVL